MTSPAPNPPRPPPPEPRTIEEKRLRVAIVGCGKIADAHIEEIRKLDGRAVVVAVADRERLMAEQLAVRYGVPAHYGDLAEMLAIERPDVVHVATPPATHLGVAKAAMDAGAHVFCEKPLTLSRADSQTLCDYAERKRKKLTVGYTYLFDPPSLAMREIVRSGALGDIVHVDAFLGYTLGGPFGRAVLADPGHWVHGLPGKLFHNSLDHLFNKLTEFVVDDAPAVSAFGSRRREERFGDARDALMDELRVVLRGTRTTAFVAFSSHARPAGHTLRIAGTKGTLAVDYAFRTVTLEPDASLPTALGRLVPPFQKGLAFLREGSRNVLRFAKSDFHFFAGLGHLVERFYESIRDEAPLPVPHRDMLRVASWMDEVFRQVPQNRAVS